MNVLSRATNFASYTIGPAASSDRIDLFNAGIAPHSAMMGIEIQLDAGSSGTITLRGPGNLDLLYRLTAQSTAIAFCPSSFVPNSCSAAGRLIVWYA